MPNFLIKTADILLLDVPRGKRYVGEPEVLREQPAQKGGTCALYALNPLRFRFGKKDRDTEHRKERFIELVFSEYRHGLNKIEFNKKIAKLLLEEFDEFIGEQKDINIEVVNSFIKKWEDDVESLKLLNMDTSKMKKEIEDYIELCNDYIKKYDQYVDFEDYLNNKEYVDCVALAESTLERLQNITGFDAKSAMQNYLQLCINSVIGSHENYGENIELIRDNPQLMAPYYHQAVIYLAASCYQLEGSEWEPSKSIDGLMDILQELGPMVIYTEPCVVFVPGQCIIESSADKYQIHTKKLGSQNTVEGSHSLLIVGAERGKETDYVYLIDPNIPAPLTGPCQFYKITYKELLDKLVNIYGVSIQENADKIKGPFALQAKKGNFDRLCQFIEGSVEYEKVVNHKKTSIELFLEEITQQSREFKPFGKGGFS